MLTYQVLFFFQVVCTHKYECSSRGINRREYYMLVLFMLALHIYCTGISCIRLEKHVVPVADYHKR